jgi:hypothetical protein
LFGFSSLRIGVESQIFKSLKIDVEFGEVLVDRREEGNNERFFAILYLILQLLLYIIHLSLLKYHFSLSLYFSSLLFQQSLYF